MSTTGSLMDESPTSSESLTSSESPMDESPTLTESPIGESPFQSDLPGNSRDPTLPFSLSTFMNACVPVRDGPNESNQEDWEYLMKMYRHLRFLRINVPDYVAPRLTEAHREWNIFALLLINAPQTPRMPNRYGIPFSRDEFLKTFHIANKILEKVRTLEGPVKLLWRMVADLADNHVNIIDFLAAPDRPKPQNMLEFITYHVPVVLRDSTLFMRFLRCARDNENYNVHCDTFKNALSVRIYVSEETVLTENSRASLSLLTNLQAAVVISGLETPELMDIDPLDQMCVCGPQRTPPIECVLEDPVKTPCNHFYNRECLIHFLRYVSSDCAECGSNILRAMEHQARQ